MDPTRLGGVGYELWQGYGYINFDLEMLVVDLGHYCEHHGLRRRRIARCRVMFIHIP